MGERLDYCARDIARASGLFLVDVDEPGVVVRSGVLEIGPNASEGHIATIGVRRLLRQDGSASELEVEKIVRSYGYEYVPEGSEQRLRAVS